jgi:L-lysine exporter family protein LysE/ArgO
VVSAFSASASGFLLGASLIVAIGAQNMFVLRQGLRREHVWAVVVFCGAADAALVAAGVGGLAALLALLPQLTRVLTLSGAAFLAVYGVRALGRVTSSEVLLPATQPALPRGRVLAATAGFTFLNPHVYLDTVLLMGAAGSSHAPPDRPFFVLGAATASFAWFAALGLGARLLSPLFAAPRTWRVLDGLVGATMLTLAALLAVQAFRAGG